MTVHDDRALCEHAGFCGNKLTNVWKMTRVADEATGAELTAMIERCLAIHPAGRLTTPDDVARVTAVYSQRCALRVLAWRLSACDVDTMDGATLETVTAIGFGVDGKVPLIPPPHLRHGRASSSRPTVARTRPAAACLART